MGNSMTLMLDAISLGCGLYCLYTWLRLVFTRRLFKNGLIVPREKQIEDCMDEESYIRYISPSLATASILTTLYGVFLLINDVLGIKLLEGSWVFLPMAAVLASLVWYAVINSRANRTYFNM